MRPALPLQKPSKPGRFTYFYRLRPAAWPASIDVIVGWRQIKISAFTGFSRGKAGRFTYM
jgi:hypothetical protein